MLINVLKGVCCKNIRCVSIGIKNQELVVAIVATSAQNFPSRTNDDIMHLIFQILRLKKWLNWLILKDQIIIT